MPKLDAQAVAMRLVREAEQIRRQILREKAEPGALYLGAAMMLGILIKTLPDAVQVEVCNSVTECLTNCVAEFISADPSIGGAL